MLLNYFDVLILKINFLKYKINILKKTIVIIINISNTKTCLKLLCGERN